MFVLDRRSLKIIAANRKALERTGFFLSELQGVEGEDLFGSDLRRGDQNALKKIHLRVKEGAAVSMRGTMENLEVNGEALAILSLEEFDSAEARVVAFSKLGHRLCSARGQREAQFKTVALQYASDFGFPLS